MQGRMFAITAALSLSSVSLALPPSPCFAVETDSPANIILIVADDLGYGDLGCYGSTVHHTPHIDRLAAQGLRFTDFHANGPMCSPTRAALLTGRYQQRAGIETVLGYRRGAARGMSPKEVTFAEMLAPIGYTTAIFGKWHTGHLPEYGPRSQGFATFRGFYGGTDYHSHVNRRGQENWWHEDHLEPQEGYATDLITDHAVRFLEEQKDSRFCLYVSHFAVHFPWQGPYDTGDFELGVNSASAAKKYGSRNDIRQAYAEMIESLDESVGRIVRTVARLGLEENTLLFFTSDNGGHKKVAVNSPCSGYKSSLLEGGHRVPAIAYWPGRIKPNTVTQATAMTMDLFPTMAALAGVTPGPSRRLDGVNLLPLFLDGKAPPGRPLFWRFGRSRAVRRGRWKLLIRGDEVALYNLSRDIGETQNLAVVHPGHVEALKGHLEAWERDLAREAASLPPLASADEPPPPADGVLEGFRHAYYGKDQGGWVDLRRQFRSLQLYGRRGQAQLIDILDGRFADAVKKCEKDLASTPGDLEALFNLAVARSHLKDAAGAAEAMTQAVEGGMPFTRFLAGPRKTLEHLRDTDAFRRYVERHKLQLIHGPMLGCLTDESARFWVRTVDEVPVQILVSESEDLTNPILSTTESTDSKRDNTAVVEVRGLQPNTLYYYGLTLSGKPVSMVELPSFRTQPRRSRAARISVVFGGGAKYTPAHERMWDTILARNPQALLLLGDNVYIDLPEQFGEFHKYTYYRRQSEPVFRRLVRSVPTFAIWDDHDCAIGDSWLGPYRDKPAWKMSLLEGFRTNWNNPGYGSEAWPGCWFKFSIADVDFFMLDGRFYRTNPYAEKPSMLGPEQKAWFLKELRQSQATFKVVASPVPWSFDTKNKSRDTWNGFRDERNEIFAFFEQNRINGIVLISADRHRSDARRIDRKSGYPLYEFESSRLTNQNAHRLVPGALFGYNEKPSFGRLSFDTTQLDPTLTFEIVSIDDEVVHSLTLKKSELSHH